MRQRSGCELRVRDIYVLTHVLRELVGVREREREREPGAPTTVVEACARLSSCLCATSLTTLAHSCARGVEDIFVLSI